MVTRPASERSRLKGMNHHTDGTVFANIPRFSDRLKTSGSNACRRHATRGSIALVYGALPHSTTRSVTLEPQKRC